MRRRVVFTALLLLALAASFSYGFLAQRNQLFPYGILAGIRPRGPEHSRRLWFPLRADPAASPPASELGAVPYLQGYRAAPGPVGVTVHDEAHAQSGLNLYVSAHAPEAFLMDMKGRVLRRWRHEFERVWAQASVPDDRRDAKGYWRRARLLPGGGLLALFDGLGLIRIDRDSHLVWAYAGLCHHDLVVGAGGLVYVLTRERRPLPRIGWLPATSRAESGSFLEDFVTLLSPDGKPVRKVSLFESLERSAYAPVLARMAPVEDAFHANAIEVFDGRLASRSRLFRKGNALVSFLNLDTIAVVDLEAGRVEWALSGLWRRQHAPTLLDSGRMLLFDNRGARGRSKVLEFDPFSQEVRWEYGGEAGRELFSEVCGSAQRLPNGNTLIVESTGGRALEVTPDKRLVWEFFNPARAGERGELIAMLPDLVRLPRLEEGP